MKSNSAWIPWRLERMPTLGEIIDAGELGKCRVIATEYEMAITTNDESGRPISQVSGGPMACISFPLNINL
jgi:hypothetical protein